MFIKNFCTGRCINLLIIILIINLIIAFTGCGSSESGNLDTGSGNFSENSSEYVVSDANEEDRNAEGELIVDILSVGKGDCSVLRTAGHVIMIDAGFKKTADIIDAYLEENGISRIDVLILTHFDKDHIGGAANVVSNYEIGTVYVPDYSETELDSKHYDNYVAVRDEKGLDERVVNEVRELRLDDIVLTIYPPLQKSNNKVVVWCLRLPLRWHSQSYKAK